MLALVEDTIYCVSTTKSCTCMQTILFTHKEAKTLDYLFCLMYKNLRQYKASVKKNSANIRLVTKIMINLP